MSYEEEDTQTCVYMVLSCPLYEEEDICHMRRRIHRPACIWHSVAHTSSTAFSPKIEQ